MRGEGNALKTTRGVRNRWLVAFGAVALAMATSGCSMLIAGSGVSSVREIYKPETRAEVGAAFGAADETYTSVEGRTVEHRTIRQRLPLVCGGYFDLADGGRCGWLGQANVLTLGLADVFVIPVIAVRSERAKLHYVFVYGDDRRALCRYNVNGLPQQQFEEAVRPLTDSLFGQLNQRGCPSWEARLSAFGAAVRQRATCLSYSLLPTEQETLRLAQALAVEVDAGRLAPDDTLEELRWCLDLGNPPSHPPLSWSCPRP
jgi:hypothetical protein